MWCGTYNMICPYDSKNWEECKDYCIGEEKDETGIEEETLCDGEENQDGLLKSKGRYYL